MLSGRRCGFALANFFLMSLVLALSPGGVRANPVALASAHSSLTSPFVIPRFIANGFAMRTSIFTAPGAKLDGASTEAGSNDGLPCIAAATFNFFALDRLDIPNGFTVLNSGCLSLDGQFNGGLQVITQSVTIPVDVAEHLTLFAPFEMTRSLSFSEINGPLSFSSDVLRAGHANIFLFLSPMDHFHKMQRTDDPFQTSAWPSAALILLSSGLAGLAARPIRRRR